MNSNRIAFLRSAVMLSALLCASPAVNAIENVSLQSQSEKHDIITGQVLDETSQPMVGVAVMVTGTTLGTITDVNGRYSIQIPAGKKQLTFSYLGYTALTKSVNSKTLNIKMEPESQTLNDVVVVGYGSAKKTDLTGSITSVGTKDFNQGLVSSPEQLINGKIAGVQIMSNSGSPSAGSTIRIRGGASLNASNDPLIVVDGVPLESGGISGNGNNFLALINPNDIETMSVLKDASSTAIYGSRASNGVVIITTKKGSSDKLKVNVSSTNSLQVKTELADMLSTEQLRELVNKVGSTDQKNMLGQYDTDWNDEIFQMAYGTDNNVSVSGKALENLPFRASVGYYNQDGILLTDNVERVTGNINLSPSFFNDHLKLNLSAKGSINNNTFANGDAIWNAAVFNPTQPVHSDVAGENIAGYYETLDASGSPITGANLNPVGLLEMADRTSTVRRLISNFDVDYKFHFLPELKAHVTVGYDYAKGEGDVYVPAAAASYYKVGGLVNSYEQKKTNQLFTGYLNYNKEIGRSRIEATAGYDFQKWVAKNPFYIEYNEAGEEQSSSKADDQRHALISFYGRVNYSFDSKYLLTATIRRDGTSRFSKDNRWGTFPSVALAWRLSQESFLSDFRELSDLKIRASWGVTGQQEGIGNYAYMATYTLSNDYAQYRFGNNFINTYRPENYTSDLKWETTDSYNIGFDYGFFNNRISGSFDYYTRKTKDLIATVSTAAGSAFKETTTTNIGNVDSNGIEFSINAIPVQTKDWTWNVGFNMTYQDVKVKNITMVDNPASPGTLAGPEVSGRNIQIISEGYAPYMFYVRKQVYGEDGRPLEGVYADLDNNGVINDKDYYRYHSPAADYLLGFNTSLSYKNWTVATALRASIGNYVYNKMKMDTGALETMQYVSGSLNNINSDYLYTGFQTRQTYSDYYVENASFLKMDNITLSYNFGKIYKGVNLRLAAMVQNVFTITEYSGVDPEVPSGCDGSFYPRPRIYSLSLNLDF